MNSKYLCETEKELISIFNNKTLNDTDINKMLADAFYGCYYEDNTLYNPLTQIPAKGMENFPQYLTWLMCQPEYFYFLIKFLFQMDTFPTQCLILKELYSHRFPMIIGVRGLSKCITGDSKVITNKGFRRIDSFAPKKEPLIHQCFDSDYKFWGENGFHKLDYGFYNGFKETKKITTRTGLNLEGTHNHPVRVVYSGKIIWRNMEDLKIGDKIVVQRDADINYEHNNLDPDVAYTLGAMVGDGCYSSTSTAIKFTNQDTDCINLVNKGFRKLYQCELRLAKSKKRKDIEYTLAGGKFRKKDFQEKFGLNTYNKNIDKLTPDVIFSAPKESIISYIKGLFDTDGCCPTDNPLVGFSNKSIELVKDLQFLLLQLGIISQFTAQYNKKYKRDYYILQISGSSLRKFNYTIGFGISYKQNMLNKHCLKESNDNLDLVPKELVLDKLLKLRELARDTKLNDDKENINLIKPARLKGYEFSYKTFIKILNILSRSESVKKSKDFDFLMDIYNKNYYYDTIVDIKDSYSDTYDIHLKEDHSFNSNGFISHNTFSLAMYLLIAMITRPGVKCVITGAGFRQAKVVFEYMENIWKKSNVLRSCFKGEKQGGTHGTDMWSFRLGDSICNALPVGHDGSKIRGQRANILCIDEFGSINRTLFEEIMGPFLAVASDPITQMSNSAKDNLAIMLKKNKNIDISEEQKNNIDVLQNQLILSGTAYFQHNHFFDYFKKWKGIITSCGDPEKLKEYMGEDEDVSSFNHKEFSILRIPVELVTSGFMDKSQIDRIKASTSKDVYLREFGACFTDDSMGFFKRSLIEHCTLSTKNKIKKNEEELQISPMLYGDRNKKYIYGIDPAYEGDNFAIVILECEQNYRTVVHGWTTQSSDHKQLIKDGVTVETDYYHYCARKIRNLMKRFPCAYIALDTQGGGKAIMEALRDESKLLDNERVILPFIDPTQKPKDTDHLDGEHIIYPINFTNDWVTESNHALKKDMEMQDLVFPYHDSINYTMAEFYDESLGDSKSLYDTLEDCIFEIEELKNELTMIVVTETATGKQKFDTPELKIGIQRKGRLHKDRYSALLLANYVARSIDVLITRQIGPDVFSMGGFAGTGSLQTGKLFVGNNTIANKFEALYNGQMSAVQMPKKDI